MNQHLPEFIYISHAYAHTLTLWTADILTACLFYGLPSIILGIFIFTIGNVNRVSELSVGPVLKSLLKPLGAHPVESILGNMQITFDASSVNSGICPLWIVLGIYLFIFAYYYCSFFN